MSSLEISSLNISLPFKITVGVNYGVTIQVFNLSHTIVIPRFPPTSQGSMQISPNGLRLGIHEGTWF